MASPGGRSAAVTTARTPAATLALATSTARTVPCATGERTTLAHSSPPAWNPSVKAPRPRSSLGSSLRGTRVPVRVMARSRSLAARGVPGPGGGQHRRHGALVSGAAAQVGRDEFTYLRLVGLGPSAGSRPIAGSRPVPGWRSVLRCPGRLFAPGRPGRRLTPREPRPHEASFGKICLCQHQEAWRAESALQRVVVAERLLQIGKLVAVGQALHRAHLGAVRLHAEHQAGAHRRAVNPDRARPADAVLAAHVGAGVAEVVAQHVGERAPGLDGQFVLGAVDPQPHLVLVRHPTRLPFPLHRPVTPAPAGTPPAPPSAAQTSAGSTGMWSKLAPVPVSASLTALSTVAGAPIMPPSPIPLAPLSLKAEGVCRWTTSTGHIWAAVGTR